MPDPNKERTFEAGGQTYTVVFNNRAFRSMERLTGKPFGAFVESMMGMVEGGGVNLSSLSVEDLTVLMWAGLQARHDGISLDAVDAVIDDGGGIFALIGEGGPLLEALTAAFPQSEEGQAQGNGNRAQRRALARSGTGTGS